MASLLEIAQISFDGVNEKRADCGRKVSAKEQPVDAFLLQSIDSETVKAYSLWKFPALGIKDNILQLFFRDLDRSKYRTLLDIDAVVENARSFNDYYQRVRPDKYASGVDYLTKGFGYVDLDFRNKHPFAADTKKALAELKPSAVEE
jgi:hypothetical protein